MNTTETSPWIWVAASGSPLPLGFFSSSGVYAWDARPLSFLRTPFTGFPKNCVHEVHEGTKKTEVLACFSGPRHECLG